MDFQIVDDFTGCVMKGSLWNDGLDLSVVTKEGVNVDSEAFTSAKSSYKSFFKLFHLSQV